MTKKIYTQAEFDFLPKKRGGWRNGGRPKGEIETTTIRIDKRLLSIIEKLKEEMKKENNEKILEIEKLLNAA